MRRGNGPWANAFLGFMAVVFGHAIALLLMFFLASSGSASRLLQNTLLYAFFGIGFTQLIYVVPLCVWLGVQGRADTLKGVLIAALITLLLNGGCFLLFFAT